MWLEYKGYETLEQSLSCGLSLTKKTIFRPDGLVDSYYVKCKSLVDFQCLLIMSWSLKKILGYMELIVSVGGWSAVLKHGLFLLSLCIKRFVGGVY